MEFYKLQCLGNDFIVVEEVNDVDYKALAIKLCNRNVGIGALGLIVIKMDFSKYTYYNDCGEIVSRPTLGLMEFFTYISLKEIKLKHKLDFLTSYSKISSTLSDGKVIIDLAKPSFNNQMLAISDSIDSFGRLLIINNIHYTIYSLFLHEIFTIIFVDDFDCYICQNPELIANDKLFRKKTNVCFVKKIDENNIKIKCYDYINGYKQFNIISAGASVLVGKELKILKSDCIVCFDYGSVNVSIDKKKNVTISGKSELVYIGKIGDE